MPPGAAIPRRAGVFTSAKVVFVLGSGFYLIHAATLLAWLLGPSHRVWSVAAGASHLATPVQLAFAVAGVLWLEAVFDALPPRLREARFSGRRLVGLFFVPLYNLYWMFAVTGGVCAAIDRGLAENRRPRRAPRNVALNACIGHVACRLLSMLPWRGAAPSPSALVALIPPALWMVFTARVEAARRELADALAAGGEYQG